MRLVIFGAPGAGKGTQAKYIAKVYDIPIIATGDMLRAAVTAGTELGTQAKQTMESGQLVPDDVIINVVKARIIEPDCANGFLFDGFPRTIAQAEATRAAGIALDHVVVLNVNDDVIVKRLGGRRIHSASGRIYHTEFNPPSQPGLDDITGEPLVQRDDDHEDAIRKRLAVYHEQTKPTIDYYRQWATSGDANAPHLDEIDGEQTVAEVQTQIFEFLKQSA